MDEKIAELIEKNKGILRQLTDLNKRVKKLEQRDSYFPNQEELERMPLYEGNN